VTLRQATGEEITSVAVQVLLSGLLYGLVMIPPPSNEVHYSLVDEIMICVIVIILMLLLCFDHTLAK
jgi:hypothetical protein